MIKKITLVLGLMVVIMSGAFAVSITSINRSNPASTPTNASTLVWRVNFGSGALLNVAGNTSAFKIIVTSGSATSTISSVTLVSGNLYDVTVTSVSVSTANAVLRLDLKSNPYTGITRGGLAVDTFSTGQTYTIDQLAPNAPTLTEPNSTNAYNSVVKVIASLPETPKSGTVTLKFTNVSTTAISTFILNASTSYNFTFNINSIANAAISTAPSTLATGTYNVTLTYQDLAGNTSSIATQNNVLLNNAPILPGSTSISVCDNSSNNPINVNMVGRDLDNAQTLTWTELAAPVNGVLAGFPYTITSNGGNRLPTGLTFTPDPLFIGNDSFTIEINDGVGGNNSQTFYVTVNETKAYYRDLDADTYGDINNRQFVCTGTPAGYVLDSTDCDDNAVTMHAKFPFYQDNDHDGYGINTIDSVCAVDASTPPSIFYSINNTDCDDTEDTVWVSGSLYIDVDHDGYNIGTSTVCYGTRALLGYAFTTLGTDCDDAVASVWQSNSLYIDVDNDGYDNGTSTQCYGASLPTGFKSSTLGSDCNDAVDSVWQSGSLYIDVDNDGYDNGSSTVCYGTRALLGYAFGTMGSDCNDALDSVWRTGSLYIDNDGDGYDNGSSTLCYGDRALLGYSLTSSGSDCDDNNISLTQPIRYYADSDNDTYGDNDNTKDTCSLTPPTGYVSNNSDCNDNDGSVHVSTILASVSMTIFPSTISYTGHSVTFTAFPTNGGSSPSYQWFKNNIPVTTSTSATYTFIPSNGDSVYVILTSNMKCTISSTATSNGIKIYVTNPPLVPNDNPCGAFNCSSNIGNVNGLTSVRTAFDNGYGIYAGYDNSGVTRNPPVGPSLTYFNINCTAASSIGDPTSTCALSSSNTVWYKFKAPTFSAGVTIRSVLSYGQSFVPVLTAYAVTSGSACVSPVFTEIKCTSGGTLVLTDVDLAPYLGQTIYLMIQNATTEPLCTYKLSIQAIVPDLTINALSITSSSISVNFPSFSLPAPARVQLYWQIIGGAGVTYVNVPANASSYTITGLLSGSNYKIWAKYIGLNGVTSIFSASQVFGTTFGCAGTMTAPVVTAISGHCASVNANVGALPSSITTNGLTSAPSTYPYRLIAFSGNRGIIYTLQSFPINGVNIASLVMGNTYSIYYSYKCLGGAKIQSAVTSHTACIGTPREVKNSKVEYVVNGVHYVDVDLQEVIEAATAGLANSDAPQSFTIEEVTTEESNDQVTLNDEIPGNFDLIPNPASQTVSLSFNLPNENSSTLYYQVYNLQGKIVKIGELQNPSNTGVIEMDLNNFENGIYLVNLKSANYNVSKKLVVNK